MVLRVLSLTFVQRTVALLVALTALLSSCDILGKSTALHGVSLLIALIGLIPSMMVYAFPLAVYLASGSLALEMVLSDEILMLWYLPKLKRAWYCRLALLTGLMGAFYLVLAGTASQQVFHAMRRVLVAGIEQQISSIDPGAMHHISKNLVLYADGVHKDSRGLQFDGLFVAFGMQKRRGVCIAPHGSFVDHCFTLKNATVLFYGDTNPPSQGEVEELTLDVARIFDDQQITPDQQLKRASLPTLMHLGLAAPGVYQECARRLGSVIWFIAMPWFGWFHGVALGRRKKNLVVLVLFSASLLLMFYMVSNFAGLSGYPFVIIVSPLLLISLATYLFYS
jgi:hypothetical protein